MPNSRTPTSFMWVLMFLTLAAGVFSSTLFTELGQFLNLPSTWLYAVYPNLGWASVLVSIVALCVFCLNYRHNLIDRRLVYGYVVVILERHPLQRLAVNL